MVGGSPGWFNQQTSTTLWRYDAGADSWEARAPLPLGRAAHAAAVLDGKLYVAGGIGPDPQRLQVYDPETDTWALKAPLEPPPGAPGGGRRRGGPLRRRAVAGGTWATSVCWRPTIPRRTPGAPWPRCPPPAGAWPPPPSAGRLFVTGGEVLDASAVTFPQLEVFDPQSGEWTSGAPLPTARHGLGAVARDGEVYVLAGGRRAGLTVSGLVEILTPEGG